MLVRAKRESLSQRFKGCAVLDQKLNPAEGVEARRPAPASDIEVTVVMPCLNEADTVATCVRKAVHALEAKGIAGEVVVADNGSTDGSQSLAEKEGARVVPVGERGYGNALMGGIAAARGRYVIMGDADDSYDFGEIPRFVDNLRQGHDLVQGCRLPRGGGRVMPGAMPWSHRWVGNPILSMLVRVFFRTGFNDAYCGLRGFSKAFYDRLNLRCTGMEFAIEMLVKTSLARARVSEVPITLHPDGRISHPPHLRTIRDGWRTLRFLLMYCPRWLFFLPGVLLFLLGLVGYAVALPRLVIFGVRFDAHTLLVASLAMLLGYQSVLFALFTKTFAVSEGLLPSDPRLEKFFHRVTLEGGLVVAVVLMVGGLVLIGGAFEQWRRAHFGDLDYASTMRWVVPGVTATALGFETILSSFFVSILRLRRR
jgi:glycosyltransferase involved in cell wall biosynthesis